MNDTIINRVYWGCLLLSVTGLALCSIFNNTPYFVFSVGITPLILYHLFLIIYSKYKSLSVLNPVIIDSVYYFGFLVTICTLSISVILVAVRGFTDYKAIVFQFGLGLMATGYAIFARIQLQSLSATLRNIDPNEIVDEYIKRVGIVLNKIEDSSIQFQGFAENVIDNNERYTKEAHKRIESLIADSVTKHAADIESIALKAKAGLEELTKVLEASNYAKEFNELKTNYRSLGSSITSLTGRISKIENALSSLNDNIDNVQGKLFLFSGGLQTSTDKLSGISVLKNEYDDIKSKLLELSNHSYTLGKVFNLLSQDVNKFMDQSRIHVSEFVKNMKSSDISHEFAEIYDNIKHFNNSVAEIKLQIDKFGQEISLINGKYEAAGNNIDYFSGNLKSAGEIMGSFPHINNELNLMRKIIQEMCSDSGNSNGTLLILKRHVDELASELDKSSKIISSTLQSTIIDSSEALGKISNRFTHLVDFIITETKKNN